MKSSYIKVALFVVYNHRYDNNIVRINEIYKNSFSHIYHLIPFYDGDMPNVIPVYGHSYFFQSYVSQAYNYVKKHGFSHYLIISDDLILNPFLNELNFWDATGLSLDSCMLPELIELQSCKTKGWMRIVEAVNYNMSVHGFEQSSLMPSIDEAKNIFMKRGISTGPIPRQIYSACFKWKKYLKIPYWKKLALCDKKLNYPLVGGYSDIFIVTENVMKKFCLYCGVFAATGLFVELAIPTAMVLSTNSLQLIDELKLERGEMWSIHDKSFLQQYKSTFSALINDWPRQKMYLHPIKLSRWK